MSYNQVECARCRADFLVLRVFSECQVAECKIFDRHFTEKYIFDLLDFRITKISTRYIVDLQKYRYLYYRKAIFQNVINPNVT
jgi:hypothetical protein